MNERTIREKMYPRVKHQVLIRKTRLGTYLLSDECMLEIDEAAIDILNLCDGQHTLKEIVALTAKKEGEPQDSVYSDVKEFLDILAKEGVLFYTNEVDPISPLYAYDRPLSVIWEITFACNQQCEYCIATAKTAAPDELSRKEIDTILDELIELQIGLINITGGEPLLRKDVALHIARKASKNGIDLELLTNAMLVTPAVAQELYTAGIRYVQVSLDCVHPEVHDAQRGVPGAWEKAVSGIKALRNAGIHVVAAAVITSENLKYFEETAAFLHEIADSVKMGAVMPMGRGEKSTYLLTPDMHYQLMALRNTTPDNQLTDLIFCRERCSIGTTVLIAPNGDVYPCMLTRYKELKLGNLRETSMKSIYEHSELLQELFTWDVTDFAPCCDCWNRYYCGGGCRGCAFAYRGTIYTNDPYSCDARKKFARDLLKRGDPATKKTLKKLLSLTRDEKRKDQNARE